jgi:hypothetical protein
MDVAFNPRVSLLDLEVARFTPSWTPGVLAGPIVYSVLDTVTYHFDDMVSAVLSIFVRVNAASVAHEVSVDSVPCCDGSMVMNLCSHLRDSSNG